MKSTTKLRITVTLLLLASIVCVLTGKSIVYAPGFTLSSDYIDALFPAADSSFRLNFTIYLWFLMAGGVIAAAIVWIPKAWAALAACGVCLVSPVYHVIRSIQNDYGVLQFDGMCDFFLLALPLTAVIFCLVLFRAQRME